jgi:hypothetical protein
MVMCSGAGGAEEDLPPRLTFRDTCTSASIPIYFSCLFGLPRLAALDLATAARIRCVDDATEHAVTFSSFLGRLPQLGVVCRSNTTPPGGYSMGRTMAAPEVNPPPLREKKGRVQFGCGGRSTWHDRRDRS